LLLALPVFAENHLICCGASEVFIIDPANSTTTNQPAEKIWSWRAADSAQIPADFHRNFRSTDDCKPYADGTILITSSTSAVAIIDRKTKACQFFARSRNAHSGCLLPQHQLAVAASFGGDEIQFFERPPATAEQDLEQELPPSQPYLEMPLKGAHGTVWDQKRECLWALGSDELLKIEADSTKRWRVTARHALPSPGGHDLSPFHDRIRLYVTSNTEVLEFHRDKFGPAAWNKLDGFDSQKKVKSVDRHPERAFGIVYHMGTAENWWSDTIRFQSVGAKPMPSIVLPGERLYKVRWDVPAPMPHADQSIAAAFREFGATVFFTRSGRISEVSANRRPITDAHLALLADCSELTDLSLENTAVGPDGLAHIAHLPKLEWLNLYRAKAGDAGLAHLAKLPRLQHLPIGENGITDAGLKSLADNRRLVYLGLRANPITDAGLAQLSGLTQLKKLHLGKTNITRLGALAGMKRLEKIWVGELDLADGELTAFKKAHPACEVVVE